MAALAAPAVAAAQPADADAYIGPQNNPDVRNNSNCQSPDKFDRQPGISGLANNRYAVRVFGCLYQRRGGQGNRSTFSGPASFDLSGVGEIAKCPDPDGPVNGNIFFLTLDDNRDAVPDRCWFESFSPRTGQYQAIVDNDQDTGPGRTTVKFCYDPTRNNGCARNAVKDELTIVWAARKADPVAALRAPF